jgi:hypothetical protein
MKKLIPIVILVFVAGIGFFTFRWWEERQNVPVQTTPPSVEQEETKGTLEEIIKLRKPKWSVLGESMRTTMVFHILKEKRLL